MTHANKHPLSQKNMVEARDHLELASDMYRFALKDVSSADVTDRTIGEIEATRMQLGKRQKLASSGGSSSDAPGSVKYKKR